MSSAISKISSRFLFSSLKTRSLSLFAAVSVLGIIGAVFLFVLVDSIVTGLTINMTQTLLGFEAPLVLDLESGELNEATKALTDFNALRKPNDALPSWVAQNFEGLLQVPGDTPAGVRVRSVDENFFSIKKDQIEIFWFDETDEKIFLGTDNQILIGEKLYERLKFMPSDTELVNLIHPFSDFGPSGEIEPFEKEFVVAGIYKTGRVDFDDAFVLIPSRAVMTMADPLFLNTQIFLFPQNTNDAVGIKNQWNQIQNKFSGRLLTWLDRNQSLFRAINLEHVLYTMILIFVIVISSFNLAGVVAIFSASKARDVSVLKALGLSQSASLMLFMRVGFFLGLIGAVMGIFLAVALVFVTRYFNFSLPAAYGFTTLPLSINWYTVLGLVVLTPLWCALIAFLPAREIGDRRVIEDLKFS